MERRGRGQDGRENVSATSRSDKQTLAEPPWTDAAGFRSLLRRSLIILVLCAMVVTLAYFFIDKPVAYFVYNHQIDKFEILRWLTVTPEYVESAASFFLVLVVIRLCWKPLAPWEGVLFAAAVSLFITLVLKDHLKLVFGRYWPDTWIHDNPSLIKNDAYGFHSFHHGSYQMWYASFPSGHTARIFSVLTVVWVAYPRWRWFCIVWYATVIIGLVGMNYHFVGDVIGGAGLGGIIGMYTAHFFGFDSSTKTARY
jgi:membrane-associated phospholipid phosphatase